MIRTSLIAAALLPLALPNALAQKTTSTGSGHAYPERPIRLVTGYLPGGGSDFVTRTTAQKLGELLGATVVVENRTGGGTNIAAEYVARAAPDGHTLLVG